MVGSFFVCASFLGFEIFPFSPWRLLFCGSWPVTVARKREYRILAACPFVMGCSRTGS